MSLNSKVQHYPLSHAQQKLRNENLLRLHAYAKAPASEKPPPEPRDKICDFKPTPLTTKLNLKRIT